MRAAGWAVIAGMLLSVRLQSQPQQLCGRVVSIRCSRPSRIATFTVRTDDKAQFEVMIPAEHRAAFGDDIETTYEFRNICVTPRAVQDRKAVVHAPRDLEISAAPTRTWPSLPADVNRSCQADIEMPQPKATKHASYTREAMRDRIEGSVMMRVIVTTEGRTGEILIAESLRRDLDMAAVDAIKQWRLKPATHSGVPVAVAVLVEMSFRLR
jgi:TonB family protein